VLLRLTPDGSTIYSLSEAGARTLQRIGVTAVTGKDLIRSFSSAQFRHRCISTELAISGIVQGYRASTEREIAQGFWIGGEPGIAGKRPDVLLRSEGRAWWLEVERSRKNAKDYSRLLVWLNIIRKDMLSSDGANLLGPNLVLVKVVFICSIVFKAKLCRDLEASGWKKSQIDEYISFETKLYSFEEIVFRI
jgi:hypothetical protein